MNKTIFNLIINYFFEEKEYRNTNLTIKSFASLKEAKKELKKEIKKIPQIWGSPFYEDGTLIEAFYDLDQGDTWYHLEGEDCFTEFYEITIKETILQ